MARLLVTIDVPGDPKDVFDYLADFSHTAEWDPGVAEAARLDEGEVGLASKFRVLVSFAGAKSEFVYRMTAYERPWRFRLEGSNGWVVSEDDVAITPLSSGARITYDATLRLPFYLAVFDPPLEIAFRWVARASVAGLRDTLVRRGRGAHARRGAKRPTGGES
jgi:hypothetical protein